MGLVNTTAGTGNKNVKRLPPPPSQSEGREFCEKYCYQESVTDPRFTQRNRERAGQPLIFQKTA